MAQGEQCRLVNKVLHVLWIAYFYSTCFELVGLLLKVTSAV